MYDVKGTPYEKACLSVTCTAAKLFIEYLRNPIRSFSLNVIEKALGF
jgi:hypothetical protein